MSLGAINDILEAVENEFKPQMREFLSSISLRRADSSMPGCSWNGRQIDKICNNLDKLQEIVSNSPFDVSIPYIESCMKLYHMTTSKTLDPNWRRLIRNFRLHFDHLNRMGIVNMTPKIHKIYGN